jgi:amino-acid N-acetyltransferase
MDTTDYARWFRGSTPYISAYRNKTFVVLLAGEALNHKNLTNVIHDLALLHVLGVRLVLVYGARPQIDLALPDSTFHESRRITDSNAIETIAAVNGQIRTRLEGMFSTGLPNTPLHNVDLPVISGNFVVAQPIGIIDGVDHLFTGKVRRVETQRISSALDAGALLLQSPLGYSSSGQAFNVPADSLAQEIAIQLKADKLIVFDEEIVRDENGVRVSSFTPSTLDQYRHNITDGQRRRLSAMAAAVRAGVGKAQLISYQEDGALLAELFTAEGVGTQVVEQQSKPVRAARATDVAGIVEVIRPLEEAGILVRRERDRLEAEIDHFLVAELDGIVVGCCAVYTFGEAAELACVAVHENYRLPSGSGVGRGLLAAAEERAKQESARSLFVLTTQTSEWFKEQGFVEADVANLPGKKQDLYNWQRGSLVLAKPLIT